MRLAGDRVATVLVVEDNPTNLKLVEAALRRYYRVLAASSAEEALDLLLSQRPDLILMDLGLPGMGGLELTRELTATPDFANLPIVALTAHAMPADRQAAMEAGCAAFMTKPINTRTLADEIGRLIKSLSVRA